MTKFTDHLWRDLAEEHGAALAHAERPGPDRARHLRPRVLAGSTLALVGIGAAITVGLAATASTPAFAVTENSDGSVLVTINETSALPQANAKLRAMGIHEQIEIQMAAGTAPASGPVTCTPVTGATNLPGPPVKVLVGTDGTEVIGSGKTAASNTGTGTWHLGACYITGDTGSGNTGQAPGGPAVRIGSGDSGNTGTG